MNASAEPPVAGRNPRSLWPILLAVLAIALVAVLFWPRATTRSGLPLEVSVADAAAMQAKGSYLVDVREPDEWALGHIQGSTLIPLGDLPKRVSEVPRDQEVVVVCRSGNRSKHGRDVLLAAGYTQVTSMQGGLLAWKAQGRPIVTGP